MPQSRTVNPATRRVDTSQVVESVKRILRDDALLDGYIDEGFHRQLEAFAEALEPHTNESLENAKTALHDDVRENFEGVMARIEQRMHDIEARTNRTLTLRAPDQPDRTLTGLFHEDFPELITLIETGIPLILTGPTQSAKSKHVELAAEALALPYYYHAFGPTQTETALAGFNSATGEFVYRSLYLAVKYGGIWCGDEMDVVRDAGVLIWMNNGISNGTWSFPVGTKSPALRAFEAELVAQGKLDPAELDNPSAGGQVHSHPDLHILGTMNTDGNGGSDTYHARGRIDKSTLARFAFLRWSYDPVLERQLATRAAPGVEPELLERFVRACQGLRGVVANNDLSSELVISPSHIVRGVKLLAAGYTIPRILDLCVFPPSLDADVKCRLISEAENEVNFVFDFQLHVPVGA